MLKRSVGFGKVASVALLFAALTLSGAVTPAFASGEVVQVKVNGSVDDAVARLRKMVASNGMMVMGELHQGKVLAMTGLTLESESLFVGNPNVGKELFSANPGVGVVVPVRINVYADEQGRTMVSYVPPSELLATFNNPKVDKIAKMLDGKLHMMVEALAK